MAALLLSEVVRPRKFSDFQGLALGGWASESLPGRKEVAGPREHQRFMKFKAPLLWAGAAALPALFMFGSEPAVRVGVQPKNPVIVAIANIDGVPKFVTSEELNKGSAHLGIGRASRLALLDAVPSQGSLLPVNRNVALPAPDQSIFKEIGLGYTNSEGSLAGALLQSRLDALLLFRGDKVLLDSPTLTAAPGRFRGTSGPLQFHHFKGLAVARDLQGLAAFLSSSKVDPISNAIICGPGYLYGARGGFILRADLESDDLQARVVARGSYPRVSQGFIAERPWMITRANAGHFPSSLLLWKQEDSGEWQLQPPGDPCDKASPGFAVGGHRGTLYLAAWHYPNCSGTRLSPANHVPGLELGVWSLDVESHIWSAVTLPPSPYLQLKRDSGSVPQVHILNLSSGGDPEPTLAFGDSLDRLHSCRLNDLKRIRRQDDLTR